MSNIHTLQREVPSSLMTFSPIEIEMLLDVARHWMKMRVAYEIDNDLLVGLFFLDRWNPRFSIQKIEKQGRKRGQGGFAGWSVMPLRLAESFLPSEMGADPFSKQELVLLSEMMVAAVTGRLKRFMMEGTVGLPQVAGEKYSAAWSGVKAAHVLAQKLDLAAIEIERQKQAIFDEWNNGAVVNHA